MTDLDYTSSEFVAVMSKHVPGTEMFAFEVFELGQALLSWIGAVQTLGHASPGSTLDYVGFGASGSPCAEIVRDFIAWTADRPTKAPGCVERLENLIFEGKWQSRTGSGVERALAASSGNTAS
jgi:hypothetical protein